MTVKITDNGLTYTASRSQLPIRIGRDSVGGGDWLIEGNGCWKSMNHEEFVQKFGKQLAEQGTFLYGLGFGTPDDPRNAVPTRPDLKLKGE